MNMTLRWYGTGFDTVTLKQIRQIPGVTGVITTLYDSVPGEAWETEKILSLKKEVEDAGLLIHGIESVNVSDAIKVGTPDRDRHIENYITTLERLGRADIRMVCYNFMPVFDWTRTELARKRPDGSTVLAYTQAAVDRLNPEDMFIVPDTQEAIVSQAQWDRVQELRKNKRRPVKAERQGLFAGLVYCADCGSKLHFATCKGFEGKQDHYRCSKYKSGRGECSAHYIREDVLRELVLERIRAVNAYIRSDVEGFQEEWLHYRRADQERDIREDQKRVEQAKKRLATLDVVMSRLYEDYALGEISKEKYRKMTADYEAEQERLKLEIETTEEWVEQRQAMGDDLDAFIALTKKYVDVTELTQTIVNEYIRKIIIYAPDKSGGKRRQKVEIIFNFVDEVEIPVLAEPMIAESTLGRRKTA